MRRRWLLHLLVVVTGLGALGCAGARIRRETAAGLREADAQAAGGCHACLLAALDGYERLAPREPATRAIVDRRILRTSMLLALREKELGLDARRYLERARTLAQDASPADRDRLELVELVPWAQTGLPREERMRQGSWPAATRDRVTDRLRRGPHASDDPELDAYLDLALACSGGAASLANRTPDTLVPGGALSPLLEYRLGACGASEEPHVRSALAREPRFVDALAFIGRYELAVALGAPGGRPPQPTVSAARATLANALAAFPTSAALTIELANVTRSSSYRDALPLYTRVTVAVPGHQDAWYGKAVCESYLGRHAEAIESLTTLIGLGQWLTGDAYYWRAWNRHQLKQLDDAWVDVERAKALLYNTNVYALAGMIAYDRQQLDVARTNLERALEISDRNCAAGWYLGLTHAAREEWQRSGDTFAAAADCYRLDADAARADLAAAEALDPDNETRAAQIDAARGALEDSLRQEALSAYNAGFGLVRADAADRARPLLERARHHADIKARADELLAYVDRR